jgi:hypothetical protein
VNVGLNVNKFCYFEGYIVFCDTAPCTLLEVDRHVKCASYCSQHKGSLPTISKRLHGAASQKAVTFVLVVVITWKLSILYVFAIDSTLNKNPCVLNILWTDLHFPYWFILRLNVWSRERQRERERKDRWRVDAKRKGRWQVRDTLFSEEEKEHHFAIRFPSCARSYFW